MKKLVTLIVLLGQTLLFSFVASVVLSGVFNWIRAVTHRQYSSAPFDEYALALVINLFLFPAASWFLASWRNRASTDTPALSATTALKASTLISIAFIAFRLFSNDPAADVRTKYGIYNPDQIKVGDCIEMSGDEFITAFHAKRLASYTTAKGIGKNILFVDHHIGTTSPTIYEFEVRWTPSDQSPLWNLRRDKMCLISISTDRQYIPPFNLMPSY